MRQRFFVTAAVVLVAAAMSPLPASAQTSATTPATGSRPSAAEAAAIRVSEDGFRAARAIRMARIEIFNGRPKEADEQLTRAASALAAAEREAPEAFKDMRPRGRAGAVPSDAIWVPVDAGIFLSDDFVATPDRQRRIAAANAHLRRGEHARALEEFRLAEVDVGVTRVLMPLAATRTRLASAQALMQQGNYYEANLALKAAEDGMVVDTEMLVSHPRASSVKK